jgi:hypothetical protein
MFSVEDVTCTECHNDVSMIRGVAHEWETALHATGHAAGYAGGRAGCSACHSSSGFQAMVDAGSNPGEFEFADAHPVGPDCRACHQVHETFTAADWALETTDPVALIAFEDATYDQGAANLCGTCHQPRRPFDGYILDDGTAEVTSTHWGPHHGPQTAVLMGLGGALVEGSAGAHYNMVEDGCVTCHMGEGRDHTFAPGGAACEACHGEDFDFSGAQGEVAALGEELEALLVANGMWEGEGAEGHPVVGVYPEAQAGALWNYILVFPEDESLGVHNMGYIKALLEASIAAFE